MTAGEFMFHATLRRTARVNWHRIPEYVLCAVAVSAAVAVIVLGCIDLVTP